MPPRRGATSSSACSSPAWCSSPWLRWASCPRGRAVAGALAAARSTRPRRPGSLASAVQRRDSPAMPSLPTGTVTLVFTDIEGSTRLLEELGAERYAEALAEHRRALREAFARRGGVEVDTQGDAFFYAFPAADAALAAAEDAHAALAESPVAVRIGVHTGRPLVAGE